MVTFWGEAAAAAEAAALLAIDTLRIPATFTTLLAVVAGEVVKVMRLHPAVATAMGALVQARAALMGAHPPQGVVEIASLYLVVMVALVALVAHGVPQEIPVVLGILLAVIAQTVVEVVA